MGEPATPIRRRIELTVAEARLRFQQLVRVTGLTGQVTVVVDGGRPIAAIVPVGDVLGAGPAPPAPGPSAQAGPGAAGPGAARPDAARPDAGRPDAARPDGSRPGAGRPDGSRSDLAGSTPAQRPGRPSREDSPVARPVLAARPPQGPSVPAQQARPSSQDRSGQPAAAEVVAASPASSAGWLRRLEKVREDVRRQHAGRIRELSQALDEAWQALDAVRPAGTDRAVDALRAAHSDLRSSR